MGEVKETTSKNHISWVHKNYIWIHKSYVSSLRYIHSRNSIKVCWQVCILKFSSSKKLSFNQILTALEETSYTHLINHNPHSFILKMQQFLHQEIRSPHSNIHFHIKLLGLPKSVFTNSIHWVSTLHTEFLNNHITLTAREKRRLISSLTIHLTGNKNKMLSLEPQWTSWLPSLHTTMNQQSHQKSGFKTSHSNYKWSKEPLLFTSSPSCLTGIKAHLHKGVISFNLKGR